MIWVAAAATAAKRVGLQTPSLAKAHTMFDCKRWINGGGSAVSAKVEKGRSQAAVAKRVGAYQVRRVEWYPVHLDAHMPIKIAQDIISGVDSKVSIRPDGPSLRWWWQWRWRWRWQWQWLRIS